MFVKFSGFRLMALPLVFSAAFASSLPQLAEAREWNLCEWEVIPRSVIQKIAKRPDFEDIYDRMVFHCPDSAVAFTKTVKFVSSPDASYATTTVFQTPDNDVAEGLRLASDTDNTDDSTSSQSTETGEATDAGSTSSQSGSSDSGTSSDSETSSDPDGRGSTANNGGGNGSEGGSPGKGKGANNDE